jgi:hypothetical protein
MLSNSIFVFDLGVVNPMTVTPLLILEDTNEFAIRLLVLRSYLTE